MDAQWIDDHDADMNDVVDKASNSANMKLERRRRIEDLNEERRLQAELKDY